MKQLKQHYKNLIIGFGKGGKTLAAYLAKNGEEVALVEKSGMMYGGTCINVACIPTKSLITNAEKGVRYEEALEIKNTLTSLLRKKNYDNLDKRPLVTVITGHASFVSDHRVSVTLSSSGETVQLEAERIFINTGSQPFVPDIPGFKTSKRVFTSASLMDQSGMLAKLVIVGGGFIGLEFADMYAKFGAEVTILDRDNVFLPAEDADIAGEVYKVMTGKGVKIFLGASVESVEDTQGGASVRYRNGDGVTGEVHASAVLVATGRKPNLDGLNLEGAGVKTDAKGFVHVDEQLQTNMKNIWALGDINGGPQFTYISLDDFRIIRDQLFGGDYTSVAMRKSVATSVFLTPPLSHVGLREREAREQGYDIKVARLPATAVPRARIQNNTHGLLKSVVDSKTNKILGCTLFCVESSEMINTIQVAMNAGLNYQTVRDTIFTHPSMTEAFNDLYSSV